jgi:hypothetical protein
MKQYVAVVFFTLFFSLFGCNPNKKNVDDLSISEIQPKCINTLTPCLRSTSSGDFSISMNQEKITPEQPFQIHINYQGKRKIVALSGYISGKNMYMGKIPLFFKSQVENHFVTETMLGMCSEPHMYWNIEIVAEYADKNVNSVQTDQESIPIEKLHFEFESER